MNLTKMPLLLKREMTAVSNPASYIIINSVKSNESIYIAPISEKAFFGDYLSKINSPIKRKVHLILN